MATETLSIGSTAPVFTGPPGTDGKNHALRDVAGPQGVVVVFSCNHCPSVQAYEDRMISFEREFGGQGIHLVAINANDADEYPEDSFDQMIQRSRDRGFNFAYLRDEDQSVAKAYGATHTPEFFLFDNRMRLRYHGTMDDNTRNAPAVREHYLRDAANAILSGAEIQKPETYSIGCTIKWK